MRQEIIDVGAVDLLGMRMLLVLAHLAFGFRCHAERVEKNQNQQGDAWCEGQGKADSWGGKTHAHNRRSEGFWKVEGSLGRVSIWKPRL